MDYPPYNPYYNQGMYQAAIYEEKRSLRKTSSALCLITVAAVFLMTGLIYVCKSYLYAVGFVNDVSDPNFGGFTPILYYLATAASYVIGLAGPVLLYFAAKHIPLREALPFQKAGFIKPLACVALGSAICMLANIPANIVVNIEVALGFSGEMPIMPLTNDLWVQALYVITIAVIPPIVEELLFRGMILHSLRRYGDGFAIVGSALLFGLYHGNFVQFVFAFICGLIMAKVVIYTGSLWTSIFIHMVNNGISVAMDLTQRYGGEEASNWMNETMFGVLIVFGVLALVYLIIKDKQFFRNEPYNPIFRLSTRMGALFGNFGGVVLILVSLLLSVTVMMNY